MHLASRSWVLYVADAGDPTVQDDLLVVVGLLFHDHETRAASQRLRERIEAIHPFVPWPPRARCMDFPASRVAACLLGKDRSPASTAERRAREACQPAVSAIARARPPSLADFREAIASGRLPAVRDLRACDAWLGRHHPAAHAAVAALADAQHDAMSSLISDLASHYASTEILLAAAVTRVPAPPRAPASSQAVRDPRASLLETLFERVHLLLWNDLERTEVLAIRIAMGDLRPSGGGAAGLPPGFVEDALAHARQFPARLEEGDWRRSVMPFPIGPPSALDAQAHPGLVLADHLAHRVRVALRAAGPAGGAYDRLRDAEALGRRACRLLPTTRAPGLAPHAGPLLAFAWDGPPRAEIARTFRLRKQTRMKAFSPSWAADQAREWTDSVRIGWWGPSLKAFEEEP